MIDDPLNRLKAKRGEQLPQSRLADEDVILIRQLVEERNKLKAQIAELTSAKIAEKFDVHSRTIDRIIAGHGWTHI